MGALGMMPVLPLLDSSRHGPARCEAKPPPQPFRTASCIKNEPHTRDTRKITFALEGGPWTTQGAIANVAVRVQLAGQVDTASSTATRSYNPLSTTSGSELTLLVKRYENSKVGSVLHNLQPGDAIELKGPNQQWRFEKGCYTNYVMVAGGTGITPLFQCAGYVLANDAAAKVTMLTFNKTIGDILLGTELQQLQHKFPGRLVVINVVESSDGRPTTQMLKKLVPAPGSKGLIMVCGPKEMTEAIAGAKAPDWSQGELGGMLKELGYSQEEVWKV